MLTLPKGENTAAKIDLLAFFQRFACQNTPLKISKNDGCKTLSRGDPFLCLFSVHVHNINIISQSRLWNLPNGWENYSNMFSVPGLWMSSNRINSLRSYHPLALIWFNDVYHSKVAVAGNVWSAFRKTQQKKNFDTRYNTWTLSLLFS